MYLPDNPAILHLDIYPREMKMYVHTNVCTQLLTVALFMITHTKKNLETIQMSSMGKWINKMKRN